MKAGNNRAKLEIGISKRNDINLKKNNNKTSFKNKKKKKRERKTLTLETY